MNAQDTQPIKKYYQMRLTFQLNGPREVKLNLVMIKQKDYWNSARRFNKRFRIESIEKLIEIDLMDMLWED